MPVPLDTPHLGAVVSVEEPLDLLGVQTHSLWFTQKFRFLMCTHPTFHIAETDFHLAGLKSRDIIVFQPVSARFFWTPPCI
jgi:hypothetical protein